jgi:hypothetical protein
MLWSLVLNFELSLDLGLWTWDFGRWLWRLESIGALSCPASVYPKKVLELNLDQWHALRASSNLRSKTEIASSLSMKGSTMRLTKTITMLLASLLLAMLASANTSHPSPITPNPVLYLMGQEPYTTGGKNFIRYRYDVANRADFPAELFAPAPGLPPCGTNTNSSRTWVDFFNQSGKRLYGFCALGKPDDLGKIWFALEESEVPPSWVYIELNDRQTNTKYKSNLADTVL